MAQQQKKQAQPAKAQSKPQPKAAAKTAKQAPKK